MANIKSQKKRIVTNERRRQRNIAVRSRMRTYLKRVDSALDSGDQAQLDAVVKEATTELDKAAAKGVIHANSAARKKSSLARRAAAARQAS